MTTENHSDICMKADAIENIKKDVSGLTAEIHGNGKEGLHDTTLLINEKLSAIIKRSENNKIWVRWAIGTFGFALLSLIYMGINDHSTIKSLPENYITKSYMMQVLETQNKVNTLIEKSILTNAKDIEAIEKAIETNEKMFEYLRITRGEKLPDTTKK